MTDEWSFEANINRGHLPTGEPLEALYGAGWWTMKPQQEQEPPITQCHKCGGQTYDFGDEIDCENCGIVKLLKGEGFGRGGVMLGDEQRCKHCNKEFVVERMEYGTWMSRHGDVEHWRRRRVDVVYCPFCSAQLENKEEEE